MLINKEFQFDAGHRLTFHSGKCYNIHGHRYKIIVGLKGNVDINGLVKDFSDLKWIKEWLDDNRDHGYIFKTDDKIGQIIAKEGFKVYDFGELEPTAENMAQFLFKMIKEKESMLYSITVYETPTSSATISE